MIKGRRRNRLWVEDDRRRLMAVADAAVTLDAGTKLPSAPVLLRFRPRTRFP